MDYAATTPMSEEALQVYNEAARKLYGNTSSLHDQGTSAKDLLEMCRKELSKLINCNPQGIYFTSGGTESNILAVDSILRGNNKGNHIITTATEHSSLLNYFTSLENEGFDITYLPVNSRGIICLDELEKSIKSETVLASIHHVNSEIGVIQPLKEIGKILKKNSVLFHSDCVQSFGKIPFDATHINIDSISISSHKIYGPKGVGAVYIRPGVEWNPQFSNTTHESGFRPGTVNVPGIAAFIAAAQLLCGQIGDNTNHINSLRQNLINGLKNLHQIHIIDAEEFQLPHIFGMLINGIEGQYSMLEFNRYGIAISTGSACQVGKQKPSKTMIAIGKSPTVAKQFIRLSFGKDTTLEHIQKVIMICENLVSSNERSI